LNTGRRRGIQEKGTAQTVKNAVVAVTQGCKKTYEGEKKKNSGERLARTEMQGNREGKGPKKKMNKRRRPAGDGSFRAHRGDGRRKIRRRARQQRRGKNKKNQAKLSPTIISSSADGPI